MLLDSASALLSQQKPFSSCECGATLDEFALETKPPRGGSYCAGFSGFLKTEERIPTTVAITIFATPPLWWTWVGRLTMTHNTNFGACLGHFGLFQTRTN